MFTGQGSDFSVAQIILVVLLSITLIDTCFAANEVMPSTFNDRIDTRHTANNFLFINTSL